MNTEDDYLKESMIIITELQKERDRLHQILTRHNLKW